MEVTYWILARWDLLLQYLDHMCCRSDFFVSGFWIIGIGGRVELPPIQGGIDADGPIEEICNKPKC